MNISGTGRRVCIYIGESDRWHGRSLYLAILEFLRKRGAAGGTVIRGIAGYGAHSRIHTASIEVFSSDLPLVLEWVDAAERVDDLMPEIAAMVAEGLITVEDIEIVKYAHRTVRDLGSD
jgi:PII-like signaling protein